MFNILTKPHYLTPTLFNAWRWYMESDQNEDEFLKILKKEPIPQSEAITKGIIFEQAVSEICNNGNTYILQDPDELQAATEIAKIVKDGFFQQKLILKLTPDIVLYGKADVIKGSKIYDIKRVRNYEAGKYQNSIQHEIYMLCAQIYDFDYLICDGKNYYVESYSYLNTSELEKIVKSKVGDFLHFISSFDVFFNAYKDNWEWIGKTI